MAFVYILRLRNGSYYIGATRNLNKRLLKHKKKQVFSTRYKLPLTLIYAKEYNTFKEARREELRIKSWKKRKSIENLCNFDKNNIAKQFGPFV